MALENALICESDARSVEQTLTSQRNAAVGVEAAQRMLQDLLASLARGRRWF